MSPTSFRHLTLGRAGNHASFDCVSYRSEMKMRPVLLVLLVVLAGCQTGKKETDYSTKPKACDPRAIDSGLCVPGEYESY
jgi:hypothetical protein